jgi:hypothetical protein
MYSNTFRIQLPIICHTEHFFRNFYNEYQEKANTTQPGGVLNAPKEGYRSSGVMKNGDDDKYSSFRESSLTG